MEHNMHYEYEEELSLYDILEIVKKYCKSSFVIFVIGCLLSLGAAFWARQYRKTEFKQKYLVNYGMLDNNSDYQKLQLNYIKFDPSLVFQSEEYLDRFWELSSFEDFASQKNISLESPLEAKIKFFSSFMKIVKNEKTAEEEIVVRLDAQDTLGRELINKYFEILDSRTRARIITLMEQEKPKIEKVNEESNAKLEVLEFKVYDSLKSLGKDNSGAQEINVALNAKYPRLMAQKDLYQSLYAKTESQLVAIEQLYSSSVLEKIVQKRSSLIESPQLSKAKLILLAGLVLTLAVIFLRIVAEEFALGYREYREKKQTKLIEK